MLRVMCCSKNEEILWFDWDDNISTLSLLCQNIQQLESYQNMLDNSAPQKQKHQIKALLIKNLHLQKRQPCTNCCQIFTPIICLVLTILIRNAAIDNIPTQNDTIYASVPLISSKFNDFYLADSVFSEFIHREIDQWLIYQCQDPADRAFVGQRWGGGFYGMLSNVAITSPYYVFINTSLSNSEYWAQGIPPVFMEPNQTITDNLFRRYQYLNSDTLYSLRSTSAAYHLPDGAITFKKANATRLQATLRVKDVRQFLFYKPNGITEIRMRADAEDGSRFNAYYIIPEGFLSVMDMITHAFIKTTTKKTVTSGYTYLPFESEGSVFIDILINTVATIIFPLGLSLLLPVFLYLVVLQKEQKLIQMMRMNGMSILNYWAINFLYNLLISLATNIVFYLFGYIFLDISFFKQTSFGVLSVVFLGWILAQIGLSIFLQVFLSSSRAANIIGYLVAIWTNLVGATLSIAMFQYPVKQPVGFSLWPTFSFTRVFYLLFTSCSMDQCVSSFDALTEEMTFCIKVLYVSAIIFALLGMYLFQIVPQEFGVSKPILFPIYYFQDKFQARQYQREFVHLEDQMTKSDATIEQEKQRINSIEDYQNYPLIIQNLTKRYPTGKLAVDRLTLMVEDKNIFGLLGPNGAGKTTLLSMITGIFGPTSGNAYVGGHSIVDQIDKVHLQMGVCPQFDILWPTLTVEEHLYFYARLRGVNRGDQDQKVNDTLDEVNLKAQRNAKVTQLSGGMKRRLSIGISLVGDPRIVFMDEPTTGLDPENRRHLWQVLSACRSKRAIFLTTHLMEEAESLCDRIAIITNGTLRTVGDQFKLKQIYGKGYFVSISVQINKQLSFHYNGQNDASINDYEPDSIVHPRHDSILTEKESMQHDVMRRQIEGQIRLRDRLLEIFAPAYVVKEIGGLVKICVAESKVSTILEGLRHLKQTQRTNFEWAISDSTLQDVFLQVVTRYDQAEKASLLDSIQPDM